MKSEVKDKVLTPMQFALYGQVEVWFTSSGARGKIVAIDFIRNKAFVEYTECLGADHPLDDKEWEETEEFPLDNLKPILRPMSDLTDEEILKVCELADHTPFVIKKKWEINRSRNDVIYVGSSKSEYSFAIYTHKNTGYGDVTVTRYYEDINPETEQTSNIGLITQFYLERGLDCFGWIDDDISLDKTKL